MNRLTRREFLSLSTMTLTTLWLAGCKPIPAPSTAAEPTVMAEPPVRVLFIGDSFSMFLGEHLPKFAATTSPPTTAEAEVIWKGGWPLSLHWAMPETLETLQTGNWDIVVLQEDLVDSWSQLDEFYEAVRAFHAEVQNNGGETVLYLNWLYPMASAATLDEVAAAHNQIGAELGIKVSPVGLAWRRALQERPELKLFQRDQVHNNAYGGYLTTCVLYATLFDRSPVGATYRMAENNRFAYGWNTPEGWQLADEEAAFLQQIAWDTVMEAEA